MTTRKEISTYKRHRFPTEIISHCVWLYFRFSLNYCDVELLMTERGIIVSYESIHQWCLKFGDEYALKLRKRRGQPGDKWHLEEIFIKINGKTHYPMKDEELVSFFGQTTFARLGTLNGDDTN